jgi:phage terminase large subunit GpA-like protein
VPYLREIMDCLSTSSPIERVVLMKGAQTGGTEAGLNAIGYWIAHAPGLILAVWPSLDMVRKNSRTRIDPLIDGTPEIRAKVAPSRSKDPGNTVALKEFVGGVLVMTGANSATGLRSTPARYLVLDEVDGFPADADGEGDPVTLAEQRTVTFRGRRKIFLISTPSEAGISRIERAYDESDRRKFFVPCPHCGTFQVLKWACVKWPEGAPEQAYYACEACGGVIEERDKPAMLRLGEWRSTAAKNPPIGGISSDGRTAGFHLSALYSPFETWGDIAIAYAAAESDPIRLKSWTNLKLGEAYEDRDAAAIDAAAFLLRLEQWGDALPEGIVRITVGVDVQGDRIEWEIVGWGAGEESWSLSYDRVWGDPARAETWAPVDRELQRTFMHPRLGEMPVSAVAIDSGGQHTQIVYRWARERAGRKVWAIKGRGGAGVPVWPQRPPRARRERFVPYIVGVDAAKEVIMARLRINEPGPGYFHFPAGRDVDYFRQLTSERRINRYPRGRLVREWVKDPGVRNEALDCRVYAYAALHGLVAMGVRLADEAQRIAELPLFMQTPRPPAAPTTIRSKWMER